MCLLGHLDKQHVLLLDSLLKVSLHKRKGSLSWWERRLRSPTSFRWVIRFCLSLRQCVLLRQCAPLRQCALLIPLWCTVPEDWLPGLSLQILYQVGQVSQVLAFLTTGARAELHHLHVEGLLKSGNHAFIPQELIGIQWDHDVPQGMSSVRLHIISYCKDCSLNQLQIQIFILWDHAIGGVDCGDDFALYTNIVYVVTQNSYNIVCQLYFD